MSTVFFYNKYTATALIQAVLQHPCMTLTGQADILLPYSTASFAERHRHIAELLPIFVLFYACIPQMSILSAHPVSDLLRSCRCSAKIHSGEFEKSICSCKIVTVHVFLSDIESSSSADLFRSLFPFQLCLCIASLPLCHWIK